MKKHLLLLFAALLPLVASAEKVEIDGIWYNLVSKAKQAEVTFKGDSYNSYRNEYSGSITIPATVTYDGVAYSVTSIGDGAFRDCSSLTAITIPEGVTSIEDNAFRDCSSLTAITIPEGVTSIGNSAFTGCTSLTAIVVAEGNKVYDSRGGCNAIIETSTNTLLRGCSSTIIPEGVTSIGDDAFRDCSSLTTINIPEGVTSIGVRAFYRCSSLTAINIPESVTSIGQLAFCNCSSLTAITIPENVTSIGEGAFYECTSLTAITIPEGVTSIGSGAFNGCSSLTAITIPKSVKSIGSKAFANCSELTDVYCYAKTVPSTWDNAFDGSYIEDATLHVPASAVNEYKNTASWSSFGKVETFEITVGEITLSQSAAELIEGESLQLTATVSPDDADDKSISWSSNNPSIATVDNMGKVTAIAPGTATITVTANDGSGVSAQCEVTVKPASYVITFLIDGEQFFVETLTRGSAITLPEVPAKEGYTFSGWGEVPETMPAKDVTISGTFIANKYLVTFKIDDEVIAADSLEYKSAIIAPEAPEKEGYTFNGWGVVADSVPAHDLTYEGSYSINSYTLTYVVDGEAVLTLPVVYGATIPSLKAPEKEGYTFSGWGEAPETMPAKDVTISGTFTINKYLVTFKIGDEVVAADSLEYKSAIIAPEAPEKEGYTFNGWGVVADSVPAHDLTYEGSYSINSYTLTYVVDGEAVLTLPMVYGATIPSLKAPEKEGYTFSGWGDVPETMPAEDVTASGTFIPNKYLVTFKIGDEVIIADSLEYGTAIVAPEAPEKEGYTFSGWGEVAGNVPAYDLTYEGSYSINSYTLTYMVDGEVVLTQPMVYSTTIPSLKVPEKEGYTFSGWSEAPATMPAKDVTIEGTFTQLPSIYLTINQADNGCVKQHLVQGTSCTFVIEAAEGWKIHTVTFNGEDVTSQLTEEGTFTTPALQDDATLNIAYEKIDDGIAGATASRIKVQGHQGVISIAGATAGEAIGLYTTSGTLVATATAEGDTTHLTVPTGQVYIVKVADTVVKIGM